MSLPILVYYGVALGLIGWLTVLTFRVWQTSQAPLARTLFFLNFILVAFLATISLSYAVIAGDPPNALRYEIALETAFFLLYAGLMFWFQRFFFELVQKPWSGLYTKVVLGYAWTGMAAPLVVHALVFEATDRAVALRLLLNSVYVPLFLVLIILALVRVIVRRKTVKDRWKRSTSLGVVVILALGFPAFVVDMLWPYLQLQNSLIPRGFNFHPLVVGVWSLYLLFRWRTLDRISKEALPSVELDESRVQVLTARERQVALKVVQGLPNKQIASELGISYGTTKIHVYNIFNKTGVSSRKELQEFLRI